MKKKIILLPLSALLLSTLSGCDFMKNGNLLDLLDPFQLVHKKEDEKENSNNNKDDQNQQNNQPHVVNIVVKGKDGSTECILGRTLQLQATVEVVGDLAKTVTWSSNNLDVATVDQNGLVTSLKEGTAVIVATSTADPTVTGEAHVHIRTETVNAVNADNSPTTPYFMTLNDEPKKLAVKVEPPQNSDTSVDDIPAFKKTFTWKMNVEGVVKLDLIESEKKPTMAVNVTPLKVGEVTITAVNDFDITLKKEFYIKVIDVIEGDYFWQYNSDEDKVKFGYSSDNKAGNSEGIANLAGLDWEYERTAKSFNTSTGNTLGFGAGGFDENLQPKFEDVRFTNRNKKTISRIIVDTASADSMADFTVTIGGTIVIDTKAPKLTSNRDTTSLDSGEISEPLKGDIVLNWDNNEEENCGAIYIKAIRICYVESLTPHIESIEVAPADPKKADLYINKTIDLVATVIKVGDLAQTVTWSSSNEAIATVDQNGKVSGVTPGIVKIYATSTVDETIKGELEIEVKTPALKSVTSNQKAPYYLVIGSATKKITLELSDTSGGTGTNVPAEEKLFTWSTDKEGIISFAEPSTTSKPTMAVNVTALAVGDVVLTATNTLNPAIKTDICFKVITVNQGDYLWQYERAFRAQFGYSKDTTVGTKEGTATLGDLDWQYERNRVVSLNTTLSGAIGFGKKATAKEPQNSESITLTNVNTKKVSRIIVDTASTNGLATLDIKVGGVSLINGPQKVEAALANYDCISIDTGVLAVAAEGDIVLEWQNPDFDPAIHIVDKVEKGPGSVFIKAIQVMYTE